MCLVAGFTKTFFHFFLFFCYLHRQEKKNSLGRNENNQYFKIKGRSVRPSRASSLLAHASRHMGRMWGLENFSNLFTIERESRIGLPNRICAGDRSQSGSGVFLNWSKALKNLSLSRVLVGPRFACIRRLVAFTATSARPLDWGGMRMTLCV